MFELDLIGIGARLEAVRRTLGMSKGNFAKAFGVAPSVYARVIKGERLLLVQHAYSLYRLYNVGLDFIYLGDKRTLSADMRTAVERHLAGNPGAVHSQD